MALCNFQRCPGCYLSPSCGLPSVAAKFMKAVRTTNINLARSKPTSIPSATAGPRRTNRVRARKAGHKFALRKTQVRLAVGPVKSHNASVGELAAQVCVKLVTSLATSRRKANCARMRNASSTLGISPYRSLDPAKICVSICASCQPGDYLRALFI